MSITKEDLIDLGGQLNKDIKAKEKELDKIKKKLRTIMKEGEIAEAFGAEFSLRATDYTTVSVDKEAAIQSFIGVRTSQINQEEDITLDGKSLVQLLNSANFTIGALRKVFTEEGVESISTKTTQHFHTLTFAKISEE